jgi:G:T-mismatch repair DNA endonuclease (very short patch repair protein)
MECKNCGKRYNKKNKQNICAKCRDINWKNETVFILCRCCDKMVKTSKFKYERVHKRKGWIECRNCANKKSGDRLKKYKESLTKEQRSQEGKIGRNAVKDPSASVRKQWKTIKNNPELKKKKYKKLKKQANDFWENASDEQKRKILTALTAKCSRSKVSDELKETLIRENLYNGFNSEEYFHGFFPDEINHELKIIIEMYGDIYHCNKKKYKDPDEYLPHIDRTVKEQWKRDERRIACFYKHGYIVIIVWESDFRRDPSKQINRIENIIQERKLNYENNKKRNFE